MEEILASHYKNIIVVNGGDRGQDELLAKNLCYIFNRRSSIKNNWRFDHVAVVVRDINKAVEYYQSLGIPSPEPGWIHDSSTYADYKVYGKTPNTIDKTKMRYAQVGSFKIELVQPIKGKPIYKEFLDNEGEGVHHLAFWVDGLDEEAAKLEKIGIPCITSVKLSPDDEHCPNGRFAYFDTRKVGNVLIELMMVTNSS